MGEGGYAFIEIEEYEILGNGYIQYWMLGLIDGYTKDASVYCFLSDRTKHNLLPIIKKNDITDEYEDNFNQNIHRNESIKARIYSDSFRIYQIRDLKNMGYMLKGVNHSIWFGYGLFQSNIIESLWGNLKRNVNNYSGISINMLLDKFNYDGNLIKNYLVG